MNVAVEEVGPPQSAVVITGGCGTIGEVICERFLVAGSRVAILDRRCDPSLPLSLPGQLLVQEVDITDPGAVGAAIGAVREAFLRIDVLVHCAGILGPAAPLEDVAWPTLEDVLAVNLGGAVLCSRAVLPIMKQQGQGCIVFVSSIVADIGSAANPVYAAAKAGLGGLARSLAKQVGRRQIRVNCVSPGSVQATELLKNARGFGLTMSETLGLLAKVPLAQLVQAQDVAEAIVFLCSERARFITGTTMTVDAGESLGIG
ncbi:MAG TPA: SDR family oxidoreductase [Chloroflexota bacterium]|nr:SDR family oxidoreductase [Chloroflexota bacterium]